MAKKGTTGKKDLKSMYCVETIDDGKPCGKPAPTHGLCPTHLKARAPQPPKPTAAEKRKLAEAKRQAAEKAKEAALPKLVRKPFRHILGVKCTDDQYMAAGRELAKCHAEMNHIGMILAEAKKKAAADLEPIKTRTAELLKVLDSGERQVELRCERVLDYKNKQTQFIRKDTGEVFHERQMNHDEQQREFSFFHPAFDIDG